MKKLRKVMLIRLETLQQSQSLPAIHVVVRQVVSNTLTSLVGQVVTSAATLLLTLVYGYFLGDVKFGELYTATTLVLLIGIPIERGFNQQITREVAQRPGEVLLYLSNTLVIKGTMWIVLYAGILLCSWLLGSSGEGHVLVAICGCTLLSTAITNTFAALHYASGQVIFSVTGTVLEKGLSALLGFLLLRSGAGVQAMALVLLGCSIINGAWQACWLYHERGFGFLLEWEHIRKLMSTSFPFLVYGMLSVIYYRIDTVLLSLMTSSAVVGWYGSAYRLFDMLVFLPTLVISNSLYPVFSRYANASTERLKVAMEKATNCLLISGVPIATGLLVAAPGIVQALYPRSEFMHAVPVLQALAPGLICLYMNMVSTAVLVSMRQEKKMVSMAGVALVWNLCLNLILIPRYQHVGAAVVTSLTELLLLVMSIAVLPRDLWPRASMRVAGKVVLASLIMVLVIWPLRASSIVVTGAVALLVYVGAATLLGTLTHKELVALYGAVVGKA
ncbi:MAG: flippase [Ktedonobacteraceae bacterium]|nr:flippase [Ktedonobacteraceae bacterium]